MKERIGRKASELSAAFLAGGALLIAGAVQAGPAPRTPDIDVGSAAIRGASGMLPGDNLLFNGWGVTPQGTQVEMSDLALKMVLSPDGVTAAAINCGFNKTGVTFLDIKKQVVTAFFPLAHTFNGLAFSPDGKSLYASGSNSAKIQVFHVEDGKASLDRESTPLKSNGPVFIAGIAVHPTTGKLYVCNEANQEVLVVDPVTWATEATITVGSHPHTCVFGGDRRHLYVSNWGGRSVSVVDTTTEKRVRDFSVGIRPNDMAIGPDGRLFVVCAGDNTVHVIQTQTLEEVLPGASPTRRPPEGVREILYTSLYPAAPEGSTPDAAAVSPDGKTLYVANADNNDVMVADISDPGGARVTGFIPVGWYPSALLVSPDGGTLMVANGKGLHFGPNVPTDPTLRKGKSFTGIGRMLSGSVSFIKSPDAATLSAYSAQVLRNCPYTPSELMTAPGAADKAAAASIIPTRPGDPCPIRHVLYIIKENRTYDQVFGDFKDAAGKPAGNSDPGLVMYGENVTPNQHQLARDYVLLDNFYCNGEVSVDGHSWCDAAMATDYNERSWIMSYSGHGSLPGDRDLGDPTAGYLWDLCQRHGVTFKCYGEGADKVPNVNRGTWPSGRDMNRVDGWIADLHAAEAGGQLPQFMIMSLGENHTVGTRPGGFAPNACVASNDIGVGKIVQAATHSKFWPEMAIFIVEDDAQNGPDHVDAHRTAALAISPYTHQGIVDSTMYTHSSMIRTMELILGLPPMTQYDAGATPMFRTFSKTPDLAAYTLRQPVTDILARNTAKSPGAQASAKMDFDEYDEAPADELNHILWLAARGPNVPYPATVHRALLPN